MIVKSSYFKKFDTSPSAFNLIDKFIAFNAVPMPDGFLYILSNLNKETIDLLIKEKYIKEEEKQSFENAIKTPLSAKRYYPLSEKGFMSLKHRVLSLSADVSEIPGFYDHLCIAYAIGYTGTCVTIAECLRQTELLNQAIAIASRLNGLGVQGTFFVSQKIYSSIYTYKVYKIQDARGAKRYIKYKRVPQIDKETKEFKKQDFINFIPYSKYKDLKGKDEDFFPSMAHTIVGTRFSTDSRNDKESQDANKKFSENYKNFINIKYRILDKIKKFIKKPFNLEESKEAENQFAESLACEGADKLINLNLDLNNIRIKRSSPKSDEGKGIVYKTSKDTRSIFGKQIKKKYGTTNYSPSLKFAAGSFSNTVFAGMGGEGSIFIEGINASLFSPAGAEFPQCLYGMPSLYVFAESNSSAGSKDCDKKPIDEPKSIKPGIPSWTKKWNIKAPKGRY